MFSLLELSAVRLYNKASTLSLLKAGILVLLKGGGNVNGNAYCTGGTGNSTQHG